MSMKRAKKMSIHPPEVLRRRVEAVAETEGRSVSGAACVLLREALDARDRPRGGEGAEALKEAVRALMEDWV